jgi:mono/diheme cytochrome c family protein
MSRWIFLCVGLLLTSTLARAGDADAVARGKEALETRAFLPAIWTVAAYENAWQYWTPKPAKAPANYDAAFRAYYGLPAAPFANDRYPLGLRKGPDGKGLVVDCMLCHGGSVLGKSYVGLGNTTLDLQAFFEDMTRASGRDDKWPFAVSNVRGTNEAAALTEFLLSLRNADLSLRETPRPWKIHGELCEDVPAWWHLQKKTTMYRAGSANARSVRALMQFMLNPRNEQLATFEKEEPVFRDIQAYLLSIRPPKYPLPINQKRAGEGKELFDQTCKRCHGSYGPDGKYPNKIVPHKEIGTDAARLHGLAPEFIKLYNESWFAQEKPEGFKSATEAAGYQAPPLDGIWATAPYFHNGSAPTVYHVLNSKARPKIFTRSYRTEEEDYDPVKLGWKITVLKGPADPELPAIERRKVYDTTQPGRGNGGHTFGDDLTEAERMAVIEYLKTL